MNKYLAGYVFAGETIFNTKTEGSVTHDLGQQPIPSVAPAVVKVVPVSDPPKSSQPAIVSSTKKLLLVVNSLSEAERELLSKILQSVKQLIDNADILDTANSSQYNLSHYTSAREIISFGVGMSKLGNDLLLFPYQGQEKQAIKYLLVDDLKTIQANQKDEKRLLWAALKTFYGL